MRRLLAPLAGVCGVTVLLAGCGSTPGIVVEFREVEYHAMVYNPGSDQAFTAFVTSTRVVRVHPSSAARVDIIDSAAAGFATPAERTRWLAAGAPTLAGAPAAGQVMSVPPGQFSFVPQGRVLTYQEVTVLPGTPQGVTSVVRAHSGTANGSDPPATLMLKQLGFLLGIAPLPPATRSAVWNAIALLPGIRSCGGGVDLAGRRGEGLCVDAAGYETEVLVDRAAHAVLAVEQRLLRPSVMYPAVPPGDLIESYALVN